MDNGIIGVQFLKMNPIRVLSLDMSSKTGWSCVVSSKDGIELIAYGQIPPIHEPKTPYPGSYVEWAYLIFAEIVKLVDQFQPDILVIEETAGGSKSAYSQKILEFSHFLVAQMIKNTGIESHYLQTEQWRRIIGCKMNDAEKARNKQVKDYKKKTGSKLARDINNKVIGKITRKHINVRRINEIYANQLPNVLTMKDEDSCDALGLAAAYHDLRLKENK